MNELANKKFTKKLKKQRFYLHAPATKLDTTGFEKRINGTISFDNYKIDLLGSIKMNNKKPDLKKDNKFIRFKIYSVNHSDSGILKPIKIELDKNKWKEIKQILNDIMKY